MALKLNERIKTISTKLSESTGAEIGSYASEITSGIGQIKSSMSSSTSEVSSSWIDKVSSVTKSIVSSISSFMDRISDAVSSITSAASAVTSLKSSADAYVKAYEEYKASEYYKDNPPEDCEDKNSWYNIKKAKEDAVKAKEAEAIAKENAVKACFSTVDLSSGGEMLSGQYEMATLSGKELAEFCRKNKINSSIAMVKKTQVEINGVVMDLYYVYDTTKSNDKDFENFVQNNVNELKKLDPDILKLISNTGLVMEQSYSLDKGFGAKKAGGVALYWTETGNIYSWMQDSKALNQFTEAAIIHEVGHAVDNVVGKNMNSDKHSFYTSTFGSEEWRNIIKSEADTLKRFSGVTGLSGYKVSDFLESQTEYLAECFYAYFSSERNRNALKRYCPRSYQAIEQLIVRAEGGVAA